jgi:hypothetical protein
LGLYQNVAKEELLGMLPKLSERKLNSWTYNCVEVYRHKLRVFQTWGFCIDFWNHREGGMVFYKVFLFWKLEEVAWIKETENPKQSWDRILGLQRVFLLAIQWSLHSTALPWDFYFFKLTQSLTVEKNLLENYIPLPYGLRNPNINLKSENSQDYAKKPQRIARFRPRLRPQGCDVSNSDGRWKGRVCGADSVDVWRRMLQRVLNDL